jgi:hypothetical protein
MNTTMKSILGVLAVGPNTVPFLVKVTSRSDNYVRLCLERLEGMGKVRRGPITRTQRMGRRPSIWERIA